jgi:hypothetical protein
MYAIEAPDAIIALNVRFRGNRQMNSTKGVNRFRGIAGVLLNLS